jgi:hypothetical protein
MKFELYRKTLHFIETASVQVNPKMIPNVSSTGAQTVILSDILFTAVLSDIYIYTVLSDIHEPTKTLS